MKVRTGIADKWTRRTSSSTEDYVKGVQEPRADWAASTAAAAGNHAAAMVQAASRGSFAKGVQKAGSGRWQSKALGKGKDRFAGGVSDAKTDYESGVAPYLQVIEQTVLPARGPKGDPRNIQRVAVLAAALRAKKVGTT